MRLLFVSNGTANLQDKLEFLSQMYFFKIATRHFRAEAGWHEQEQARLAALQEEGGGGSTINTFTRRCHQRRVQ